MKRLLLVVALCAAVAAPVPSALAQRTARRAKPRPAATPAVSFDGNAADHLPADTFLLVEVSSLAGVAEQLGGADYLYSLLKTTFPADFPPAGKPIVTLEQFRALLGSRLTVAALTPPDGVTGAKAEPPLCVLLQTPTPEAAAQVHDVVVEASARKSVGARRTQVRAVRGVRVTTLAATTGKRQLAFAQVGSSLLLGDPPLVSKMIAENGKPAVRRLSGEPAYTGALQRAPADRQLFAFLNGKPFVKAFRAGMLEGTKPATGKPGPEAEAFLRFLGVDAIGGGSVTASFEGETLAVQASLEIDRSRGGLVSLLSDPPAIPLRTMEYLPAGTDLATVFSLDLVRLYDLVLASATPEVTKGLGVSLPDLVAAAEKQLGMRLRDDFLAAIGNEFAVGSQVTQREVVKAQDGGAPASTDVDVIGFAEVRNIEVLTRAFQNLASSASQPAVSGAGAAPGGDVMEEAAPAPGDPEQPPAAAPQDGHGGVPLFGSGSFRYAFVDGFGVLGDRPQLVRVIDTRKNGGSLATDPVYGAAAGTIPENTISATYMSPKFFEWAASSAASAAGAKAPEIPFPNGLFVSVQKDASGVFSSFRVPIPNLRALLEQERKKSKA